MDRFEIYQRWLEIPEDELPPTHYVLLGVENYEEDLSVIEQAAKKRTAHLHQMAAGPDRAEIQKLMSEIAIARRTLLNEASKQHYDQLLETGEWYQEHEPEEEELPVAEPQPVQAPPPLTASAEVPKKPSATPIKSQPRRRKSAWDEYKLHLASASVLLCIVGVVWFVNRGGGKRIAAQAGPINNNRDTRKATSPPDFTRALDNGSRGAGSRPAGSSRPRPRESGLQKAMGSKFDEVLSELGKGTGSSSPSGPDASAPKTGTTPNQQGLITSPDGRLAYARFWKMDGKPAKTPVAVVGGKAAALQVFSANARKATDLVARMRVDAADKKCHFVIGGKSTLRVHGSKFNDWKSESPDPKLNQFPFIRRMGKETGTLARGAKWGTNYLLVSDVGKNVKANKPAVLVFDLVDGNKDSKFAGAKDRLVVKGLVFDPKFAAGAEKQNTALDAERVRSFVQHHINK